MIYECLLYPHIVNSVQNTEDCCLMINARCLHKLTYNSHCKEDIRSSDSESIFSLRDNNAFLGLSDLYAKKVLQVAKIFVYPFATNRALRRSTVPLGATLIANTHLQPTAFLPEGKGTNSQVPLCSNACISTMMACRHPGWLSASQIDLGIDEDYKWSEYLSEEQWANQCQNHGKVRMEEDPVWGQLRTLKVEIVQLENEQKRKVG
ncbi:hypothetical protein CR513_43961, partial [Mucuna pruriens]